MDTPTWRASRSSFSVWPWRTHRSLWSFVSVFACLINNITSYRYNSNKRASFTRMDITWRTWQSLKSGQSTVSLHPLFARRAGVTLGPRKTGEARQSALTLQSGQSLRSFFAGHTSLSLWPLWSRRADGTGDALDALVARLTGCTRRSFVTGSTRKSG